MQYPEFGQLTHHVLMQSGRQTVVTEWTKHGKEQNQTIFADVLLPCLVTNMAILMEELEGTLSAKPAMFDVPTGKATKNNESNGI